MEISPIEIKRQTFKKSMRGYDTDEVHNFLELISAQMEGLIRENGGLYKDVERFKSNIEKYEKLENAIQETLVTSQRTLNETKKSANYESEIIIREAELKADELIHKAVKEKDVIKKDITLLTETKQTFLIKFRSLLKSQLEMVNLLEMEVEPIEKTSKRIENNGMDNDVIEELQTEVVLDEVSKEDVIKEENKNFSAKI